MEENSKFGGVRDEQLIKATLRGDISKFGLIVERYWKTAVALAISKICDVSAAEDIAQDSFIKAYFQLGKLRKPSCFAGWLCRIVNQECVNYLRRKARQKSVMRYETAALEAVEAKTVFNANPGLTSEQVGFVREKVRQLPQKFQKLIIMRFVAGLSAAEIARQLGKRHGTIRVWLHRAYKILREELAPLLEEVNEL